MFLEVLPPNLETFTLQHFAYNNYSGSFRPLEAWYLPDAAFKAVKALLQHARVAFPSLKKVSLDVLREQAEKQNEKFVELFKIANSFGIQFAVLGRRYTATTWRGIEREWGFNEDVRWQKCDGGYNKKAPHQVLTLEYLMGHQRMSK